MESIIGALICGLLTLLLTLLGFQAREQTRRHAENKGLLEGINGRVRENERTAAQHTTWIRDHELVDGGNHTAHEKRLDQMQHDVNGVRENVNALRTELTAALLRLLTPSARGAV